MGADRMLSFLGASLAARLSSSRPPCLLHELPTERSPIDLASAISTRFADSQTACATLCVLDPKPILDSAAATFPSIDSECFAEDLARCLSTYFEALGGLFLCDSGELVCLCCGSRPVDTGLLKNQVGKYIRKFISSILDCDIDIPRSKTFESPRVEEIEAFLSEYGQGAGA